MPFKEIQGVASIFFRALFIGIVATTRHHSELTFGEVAVECDGLFHRKQCTPVRIEHKGRAGYPWQQGSQVKNVPAIGPSVLTELVI